MTVDPALLLEHIERAPQRAAPDTELGSQRPFRRDSPIDGEISRLDEVPHLAQSLIAWIHIS
jgi:hypothetical protein